MNLKENGLRFYVKGILARNRYPLAVDLAEIGSCLEIGSSEFQ